MVDFHSLTRFSTYQIYGLCPIVLVISKCRKPEYISYAGPVLRHGQYDVAYIKILTYSWLNDLHAMIQYI